MARELSPAALARRLAKAGLDATQLGLELPGQLHRLLAVLDRGGLEVHLRAAELIDRTIERFGRLDFLVNNAGWTTVVPHTDLDALTDEIFDKTFRVNVYGTWWLTKAAMPWLRASDDACVVNVTSIAGHRPGGSSIAYAMTKAALNHMTPLLAKSCAPVRVNAVAPGLVDTPWTADWHEIHKMVAERTPLQRVATAEDCAEAVLALVRTRYVTGHVMVVDGGYSLV